MKPELLELEPRNCPSPLAVPAVAPPPAGYQVIVAADIANQNPMFAGLAGLTPTLAEPNGLPTVPLFGHQVAIQQALALAGAINAPSTITVIPGDAWYVENALLPEGFVPGTTVSSAPPVSPVSQVKVLSQPAPMPTHPSPSLASLDAAGIAAALGIGSK